MAELAVPEQMAVAIERSDGIVVGLLGAAGHSVLVAEPAGFRATRPRWGSVCTNSDAGDAFMLADYARTDGQRLHRVLPVVEATRELGVLARARSAVVDARTAASNQLWAVLAEHWPGAAMVFQKLTSKITLAFLTDYPTPQAAAHLGEGRMGQFCQRHAYGAGKLPLNSSADFELPLSPRCRSTRMFFRPSSLGLSPKSGC
ncbi:MAG: transposase [Microthrixaceae bacterium]|nr:transposase [Microthrixaceae bacterium]